MNFFRKLFGGPAGQTEGILHLYVRCNRCNAPIHVRINLFNDLAVEYDDREQVGGYHLRKEMMDARCFRLIYADLHFDRNRRELSRTLEGGTFINEAEYTQLMSERERSL